MYYIQDFPQIGLKSKINLYKNNKTDLRKNALKAFQTLSEKMNFDDNQDGQVYLRFWLSDDNGNIYPYIGTVIKYEKVKYSKNTNGNETVIYHRNVVSEYQDDFNSMFYPKKMTGGQPFLLKKIKK